MKNNKKLNNYVIVYKGGNIIMNEKQIIIPIDDIGVIEGVPIHYLKLIEGNDDNNPTYKDSPHGNMLTIFWVI